MKKSNHLKQNLKKFLEILKNTFQKCWSGIKQVVLMLKDKIIQFWRTLDLKFTFRPKELVILFVFIVIASFSTIKVKDVMMEQELKNSVAFNPDTIEKEDVVVSIIKDINKEIETSDTENKGDDTENTTPPPVVTPPAVNDSQTERIVLKGNALAVIDIPKLGIKGQVVEGTDDNTLKNYIGKVKGTANPGEVGNFCVAAHNNIYTEIFRNLHRIQVGDKVRVVTRNKQYIYQIQSKETVNPRQIEVLEPKGNGEKEITLITCNSNATARIIAKGVLIASKNI